MKRLVTVLVLIFIILLLWNEVGDNGLPNSERPPATGITNNTSYPGIENNAGSFYLVNDEGPDSFQTGQEKDISSFPLDYEEKTKGAYLGIVEGRLAIFSGNEEKKSLKAITDIEIEQLAPEEQQLLEKGLRIASEEELLALLDGYISRINDD